MYLVRNERWTSPMFLAGESYGTTRASALSGYLVDRGIALNGIVLISTIMNFATTDFAAGQRSSLHHVPAVVRGHRLVSQKAASRSAIKIG
jgi:carboxypeptidase C (cathepsin A)